MKHFQVTFCTVETYMLDGHGEPCQFSRFYQSENKEKLVEELTNSLMDYNFMSDEEGKYFYRVSSITSFGIEELEENE